MPALVAVVSLEVSWGEGGWQVRTLPWRSDAVSSVTLSPDGKRVVSVSDGVLLEMWNTETGIKVRSSVEVH